MVTPKRTASKTVMDTTPISDSANDAQMAMMESTSVKKRNEGVSRWEMQKELQKEMKPSRYAPKILMYGENGTGKTHNLCSAFNIEEKIRELIMIPSFKPIRIIDCNRSAIQIACKDFPKEYKNGDIIIINPYVELNTEGKEIPITDPIKKFTSVWNLIKECRQLTNGSLGIDGYDLVEKDAMIYTYRQYGLYEMENGTLWKKGKTNPNTNVKEADEPLNGIPPLWYGPRNMKLVAMLQDLSLITIPVIVVAHPRVRYVNQKPTENFDPNIIDEVSDEVDVVLRFENFEKNIESKVGGTKEITVQSMRKMHIKKNRFQRGKKPDNRAIERESFEMDDILNLLLSGG